MSFPAGLLAGLLVLAAVVDQHTSTGSPATQRKPPARPAGKYTTRFDYIDVDTILKSNRLLKNYMDCVMERGPCTREGLELRRNIPDALATECSKCSEKQKENAGKIMAFMLQYKKEFWKDLLAKYDPQGTFRKKYDVEDFGEGDEDYNDNDDDTDDQDKK